MKTAIPILTVLLGIFLIIYSLFQSAQTVAVWSDFKAFGARVAEDKQCEEVLKYGGEDKNKSFKNLLNNIWNLKDNWTVVMYTGVLLIVLSIIQIISNKKKHIEQRP